MVCTIQKCIEIAISYPDRVTTYQLTHWSKRMLTIGTQCAHILPVKDHPRQRVRTGYERTLAHRVGRMWAGIAEEDGVVTKVDDKLGIIEVTYNNKTRDVFKFGEFYTEFQGFYATQNITHCVKLNQKIKKGEVVTYNEGYFNRDKETGQLDYCIGTEATLALLETDATLEDSCEISQSLADKLTIYPTNIRVISLPAKAVIHQYVKIGQNVEPADPLMIFEEEPMEGTSLTNNASEETMSLLADINRKTPSAKYSGEVVKIEAYYGSPIEDMSGSVRDLVEDCIRDQNQVSKLAKGCEREDEFPETNVIPAGDKFKGVSFDENTVVLIYYIKEEIAHNKGDKLVFYNQLKSTCCGVFTMPIYSESGIPIDAYFGCLSVSNRICLAPLLYGISARIMKKIEQNVLDLWFEGKELPKI